MRLGKKRVMNDFIVFTYVKDYNYIDYNFEFIVLEPTYQPSANRACVLLGNWILNLLPLMLNAIIMQAIGKKTCCGDTRFR